PRRARPTAAVESRRLPCLPSSDIQSTKTNRIEQEGTEGTEKKERRQGHRVGLVMLLGLSASTVPSGKINSCTVRASAIADRSPQAAPRPPWRRIRMPLR